MIKGSKDLFITYQHMHTQLVKQCSVPSYVLQMQKILIFYYNTQNNLQQNTHYWLCILQPGMLCFHY